MNITSKSMKKRIPMRTLCGIGILSALAAVLQLFEIPLFFAPSFYKLDLSDVFALLGGFSLGPCAGALIQVIKNLLNLLLNGTTTAFVGELANAVTGCLLVVPAALVYRKKKTFTAALGGLLVGTYSLAFAGALINAFVMIPFYSSFYGMPMAAIVGMGHAINPLIQDVFTLVLFAVVPFNLVKGAICTGLTLLLYKRVSRLLHPSVKGQS